MMKNISSDSSKKSIQGLIFSRNIKKWSFGRGRFASLSFRPPPAKKNQSNGMTTHQRYTWGRCCQFHRGLVMCQYALGCGFGIIGFHGRVPGACKTDSIQNVRLKWNFDYRICCFFPPKVKRKIYVPYKLSDVFCVLFDHIPVSILVFLLSWNEGNSMVSSLEWCPLIVRSR